MSTYQHYREQLWEYLFDLVEGDQAEQIRRHLETCSECREEHARLEQDQKALDRAALLDVVIPLFVPPTGQDVIVLRPVDSDDPPVRPWLREALPWLATAAALLLAVSGTDLWYQSQDTRHRTNYESARQRHEEALAELRLNEQNSQRASYLATRHEGERHLCLQVQGPDILQSGNAHTYLVRASNLNGRPLDVPFTARLRDANNRVLFEKSDRVVYGKGTFTIPASLNLGAPSKVRLEVLAEGPERDRLEQVLEIRGPAYATALTLDKSVYQPGEKVFFRSVTVDRFSLRPPPEKLGLYYTVTGPDKRTVTPTTGQTLEGGLGGGEFPLTSRSATGEFLITVSDVANRFEPVSRRFWVRNEKQALTNVEPGKQTLTVEFFPEGGDLLADSPNRVYWRILGLKEKDQQIIGIIEDSKHREVARLQPGLQDRRDKQMLGSFTFMPASNERYTLKLQTSDQSSTHPLPQATSRIGLGVPVSVVKQGEPLRLEVTNSGEGRELLIAVTCRGRLLVQHIQECPAGRQTSIEVPVPKEAMGVLRVTVLEYRLERFWPLAERLAYCFPGEALGLQIETDRSAYRPGEHVNLKVQSKSAAGENRPAWLFVSVVDDEAHSYLHREADSGLPAALLLGPDLEASADLEMSLLATRDTPQARQAIDLVLATKGWRRFAQPKSDEVLAALKGNGPTAAAVSFGLIGMDNLQASATRASTELKKTITRLTTEARDREQAVLAGVQTLRAEQLAAEKAWSDAHERATQVLGTVQLVSTWILAALACLALALAVRRAGQQATSPSFAAAAVCSSLGLLVYFMSPGISPLDLTGTTDAKSPALASVRPSWEGMQSPAGLPGQHRIVELVAARTGNADRTLVNIPLQPLATSPLQVIKESTIFIGTVVGSNVPKPVINPLPLPLRQYAYQPQQEVQESRHTILWSPLLVAADGTTQVGFDLPKREATYRIQVDGHTATGELGALRKLLEVRK